MIISLSSKRIIVSKNFSFASGLEYRLFKIFTYLFRSYSRIISLFFKSMMVSFGVGNNMRYDNSGENEDQSQKKYFFHESDLTRRESNCADYLKS